MQKFFTNTCTSVILKFLSVIDLQSSFGRPLEKAIEKQAGARILMLLIEHGADPFVEKCSDLRASVSIFTLR